MALTTFRQYEQRRSNLSGLVTRLVDELRTPSPTREPLILEERLGPRVALTVIWSAWHGVDRADRGWVIVEAVEQSASKEAALAIGLSTGLTPDEAIELGLFSFYVSTSGTVDTAAIERAATAIAMPLVPIRSGYAFLFRSLQTAADTYSKLVQVAPSVGWSMGESPRSVGD